MSLLFQKKILTFQAAPRYQIFLIISPHHLSYATHIYYHPHMSKMLCCVFSSSPNYLCCLSVSGRAGFFCYTSVFSAWLAKDEAANWNVHLWMTALLAAARVHVIGWVVSCRVRALKVEIIERGWNPRPCVNENSVRVRTDQRSDALMGNALVSGTPATYNTNIFTHSSDDVDDVRYWLDAITIAQTHSPQ